MRRSDSSQHQRPGRAEAKRKVVEIGVAGIANSAVVCSTDFLVLIVVVVGVGIGVGIGVGFKIIVGDGDEDGDRMLYGNRYGFYSDYVSCCTDLKESFTSIRVVVGYCFHEEEKQKSEVFMVMEEMVIKRQFDENEEAKYECCRNDETTWVIGYGKERKSELML
ncbi:unnamed protein product [Enterobius vermicularis]|uniref:Transmembrane protein n=1 Tax=Enterobius vermicularis TaxID=51028 RepID=A0A0N4VFY8_ENTVE|nr:unnamed protein product [Enterobius vermicularis]